MFVPVSHAHKLAHEGKPTPEGSRITYSLNKLGWAYNSSTDRSGF